MAITDTHAHYAASAWKRCRDAVAGQRSIHNAGEAYLPKLSGQTDAEYKSYRTRAGYYNASGRTLDGMVGLVFRKSPTHDFPSSAQSLIDDVTLSGTSAAQLSKAVLSEVLTVGRAGVLVEFPAVTEPPANAAQAAAMNLRPYLSLYDAEAIINWRSARVNNVFQPVLVLLAEKAEIEKDEWNVELEDQIRELSLANGVYRQRVFRKDASGAWYSVSEVIPLASGQPMRSIPFVFFGAEANSEAVQLSPLTDLVDVNVAHYRVSADYEHGCHFAGLPTPVISGYTPIEGETSKSIGSSTAWTLPDPSAKAYFLEFTGQGLSELRENLKSKEGQMAALGARMLAPEKSGVEAAATLSMRHNGEQSALAAVAGLVAEGFTRALRLACGWMGIAGADGAAYRVNTDYLPAGMTAQELQALVSAWQQGAISRNTLFSNLQRGEIIAAETHFDDEEALIAAEGPSLTAPGQPGATQ